MGCEERRIRRRGRGGGGDELARGRPGTVRTPPIILFSLPCFTSLPFAPTGHSSLSSSSLCLFSTLPFFLVLRFVYACFLPFSTSSFPSSPVSSLLLLSRLARFFALALLFDWARGMRAYGCWPLNWDYLIFLMFLRFF